MTPPTAPLHLDVEAISGICGSISIACWVVVFSPQILENFRRSNAEGLSIQFIVAWLLGDVFNILGAVLQGVLPTMIILAIYYTIADFVLLGQCFYYRGFTWRDEVPESKCQANKPLAASVGPDYDDDDDERTALIAPPQEQHQVVDREHRDPDWSADLAHLSPAVPLVKDVPRAPTSTLQSVVWSSLAILMVCAAGVAGWWLSRVDGNGNGDGNGNDDNEQHDVLVLDLWGQVFGWLCAVLYLGSRVPQLLLNWRRKSTEGVSMLFFLYACLGNLTYVLSILAFDPRCEKPGACRPYETMDVYLRYLLVNSSWLAGSAGTLLLDMGIFAQCFMYNRRNQAAGTEYGDGDGDGDGEGDGQGNDDEEQEWYQRPVLERNASC